MCSHSSGYGRSRHLLRRQATRTHGTRFRSSRSRRLEVVPWRSRNPTSSPRIATMSSTTLRLTNRHTGEVLESGVSTAMEKWCSDFGALYRRSRRSGSLPSSRVRRHECRVAEPTVAALFGSCGAAPSSNTNCPGHAASDSSARVSSGGCCWCAPGALSRHRMAWVPSTVYGCSET